VLLDRLRISSSRGTAKAEPLPYQSFADKVNILYTSLYLTVCSPASSRGPDTLKLVTGAHEYDPQPCPHIRRRAPSHSVLSTSSQLPHCRLEVSCLKPSLLGIGTANMGWEGQKRSSCCGTGTTPRCSPLQGFAAEKPGLDELSRRCWSNKRDTFLQTSRNQYCH